MSSFAGTTKVELNKDFYNAGGKKSVVLSDPTEISRLVKTIRLRTKEPCKCEHAESATFTTPAGQIEVSLCDHCFDFGGKTYKMPAGFYKLFQSYFKE